MSRPIQSAVLECSWNVINPEMIYCTAYNITPVTQPNEIITINGQPSDYVNPTTIDISFYNQVINYIPTALFTIFPNLESLHMINCGITTLMTDSIPNCGVLNTFFLQGGTFTSIPAGVLQSCTKLRSFDVDNTNAATVDVDAFRGLTNAISLGIINSKISCIPLGLFQHTPKLITVNFHSNMITSIDSNLFANLLFLSEINLSNNLITYVPVLNLTQSPVSAINLNTNPINALAPDFCSIFVNRLDDSFSIGFSGTSCIPENSPANNVHFSTCQSSVTEFQSCYDNWTPSMNTPVSCPPTLPPTTLPPTTMAPTTMAPTTMEPTLPPTTLPPPTLEPTTLPPTTLKPTTLPPTTEIVTTSSPNPSPCPSDKICRYFLDQYYRYTCILDGVDSVLTSISGNHLITFSDVNVRRVVFTNSFLSRIPPILFQKFTSLEYLTVSNCSISAINKNTFTACGNLKYFDASDNFITTVDGASFKSCAALEVIDLTGNKFDFISGQLFVNNPTLKAIYINRPPAMVLV